MLTLEPETSGRLGRQLMMDTNHLKWVELWRRRTEWGGALISWRVSYKALASHGPGFISPLFFLRTNIFANSYLTPETQGL